MKTETVDVSELSADPKNVRRHDDKNIAAIKRSLDRFGQQKPIVVSKDGRVVAGNGTLAAAAALGWQSVAVVRTSLKASERTAYAIADNRTAELAEWDDGALAAQLSAIAIEDEALLAAAGFDAKDLDRIVSGLSEAEKEKPKTEIPIEQLDDAWRQWAAEMVDHFERAGSFSGVSPGYAKVMFLRAKHTGARYPRACSHAFHPQQFDTPADVRSALDGLRLVASGGIKPARLRFAFDKTAARNPVPRVSYLTGGQMPFAGSKFAPDFPPELAESVVNEFARGGRVLDPCHGWGGRLVGFLLSDAAAYHGVDVSPLQSAGVKRIAAELGPLADDGKRIELTCAKFEDAPVEDEAFDLAITSPPYFDTEKYLGGAQSHEAENYSAWRDGFYASLLRKTFRALRAGGTFALQVGSQRYPLLDDGKKIGADVGFAVEGVRLGVLTANANESTTNEKGECLLILKKAAKGSDTRWKRSNFRSSTAEREQAQQPCSCVCQTMQTQTR